MFNSGNVTIPVTNMDRSVRFYTDALGLKLAYRYGDHFAAVQLGGLTIGLHPASEPKHGSMSIGFDLIGSIDEAMRELQAKGVTFTGPVSEGKAGKFVHFTDPDGNSLYMSELNRRHVDQGEGKYPA